MRSFSHAQRAHTVCYLSKHKQIGCSVAFRRWCWSRMYICWMNKAPTRQQKAMEWWRRFLSARQTIDALSSLFGCFSVIACALDDFRCDLEPECERWIVSEMAQATTWHSPSRLDEGTTNKIFPDIEYTKYFDRLEWRRWCWEEIQQFAFQLLCICSFVSPSSIQEHTTMVEWEGNYMCSKRRRWWWWCSRPSFLLFSGSVFDYEFNNSVHTIDGSSARAKGSSLIIISLFVGKWCEHVNHYRKNCWCSLDCTRPFVCVGNNTKHNKKSSSKQHHIGIYSLCMLMMMIYEQNASCSSSQQSDSGEEWKRSIKISSESFGACVCDPSDETDNEYAQFLIRISFGISIMLHRDFRRRRIGEKSEKVINHRKIWWGKFNY